MWWLWLLGCTPEAEVPQVEEWADRYALEGDDLYPEGIGFDVESEQFVLGSLEHGTVTGVARDGSQQTLFTPDEAVWATLGIKAIDGDLWTCAVHQEGGVNQIWRIRDGALLDAFDLDLAREEGGCNDLAAHPDGGVVASDSQGPYLYRVSESGEVSVLASDERFNGGIVGLNGLAATPGGEWLMVALYSPETLFRVALDGSTIDTVSLDGDPFEGATAVAGPDGLVFHGDTLAVVFDDRVQRLSFAPDYLSATVSTTMMGGDGFSTGTVAGDRLYAVKSEVVNHLVGLEPELPFEIVAVP